MSKYKRFLLRLTMKNGLEVNAPVNTELTKAISFAIKVIAVGIITAPVLYGVARVISAIRWW